MIKPTLGGGETCPSHKSSTKLADSSWPLEDTYGSSSCYLRSAGCTEVNFLVFVLHTDIRSMS